MCITALTDAILNMYYCNIEISMTGTGIKSLKLDNGNTYFYSVKEVEVSNILGTAVVVLQEYLITNSSREKYILHKTDEGNWYEIQGKNNGIDNGILLALKLKIDSQ